ncbi:rhomboid family intramembrane serine protease [Histidinibacterium aquaticum]|uniref:Rhomboid family intramembrane serine protease n=1 Tax=Histidinibacterium aquaticum TaxID=2613962 RepID=A0A5J5GC51_9RHOB|nr:rhomboid family intramembrane serine protease [Histidinibacterium aquaticum]KAA9005735.1 rhomboid family intramembrane serine protease [Histidinibacterium aquaticum]
MFPIRDHNPSQSTPVVVFALIAINVAVFLYDLVAVQSTAELSRFYARYALVPAFISQGEGLTGIVTHMFLHGGIMHLAGNMLFLWVFGDNLEDEMGHVGFLLFYLASGFAAGFAQYIGAPFSQVPMVGASGAIAGVMGGYLLLFPKAKIDVFIFLIIIIRIIPVPAWIMLLIWFGLQVINGVSADLYAGGTAYWAHAGGFVAGLALTVPLWLRLGAQAFWERSHGHPPHPEAQYSFKRTSVPTVQRRPRRRGPWGR